MTDRENIKNIVELFIAWNGETEAIDIANLDSAIDFIADSLQEESIAPKVLEDMLNAKTAAESLGISQEEHDRIVDELIYGKEPELVDVDDLPNKEAEPVSENLDEEIDNYVKKNGYDGLDSIEEVKYIANHFANWQKQQDQETIELAEDHAMLAGMEKMKEQMMAKAVDAQCFGFQGAALFSFRLPSDNYLVGSKVKVIVIKED